MMKRELDERYSYDFERSFDYIWDKIVWPAVALVEEQMDPDFKQFAKLELAYRHVEEYKNDIKAFYREKREWLKEVYLPHEKHPFLDEHKLGAIWCRTVIAFKPFYFDFKSAETFVTEKFGKSQKSDNENDDATNNSEWFTKNIYCNYRVAFLVSVGVVYLYLLYDCKEKDPHLAEYLHEAYDYFREKKVLRCPPTTISHNNFSTSCIIALQKNDTLERDFDYLTYAIMLYQLEHYNRTCYYMQKNGLSLDEV